MGAKRQIFYSFHFDKDVFRVQQIRNIGSLEDNKPVSPNEWETVRQGKDAAIEKWIHENMKSRSCVVVLIGEQTHERPWVRHEIKKAWNDGKGLLGIYIHNIKCMKVCRENSWANGKCSQGRNPFDSFTINGINGPSMSSVVQCYNPESSSPYKFIQENLEDWVEQALKIRAKYS